MTMFLSLLLTQEPDGLDQDGEGQPRPAHSPCTTYRDQSWSGKARKAHAGKRQRMWDRAMRGG